MKLLLLLITPIVITTIVGCKSGDDKPQTDDERNMEADRLAQIDKRILDIDLALTKWAVAQGDAELALTSLVKKPFGPIVKSREHGNILKEQLEAASWVESNFSDVESAAALENWRRAQLEAANHLKEALRLPVVVAYDEAPFSEILERQNRDLTRLYEERAKLESEAPVIPND